MRNVFIKHVFPAFCALLLFCFAGCAAEPDTSGTEPSAQQSTAAPTAEPTAEPTPEPTEEPTPEPTAEPETVEITAEITAMYPLLEAHVLARLNGGTFSAEDPVYFWQAIIFAMDTCGMDFYTAETMGSALVLSRGVIEEMASGLFEGAGDVLLEIPDELSDMIQYDQSADAFSCSLNEGSFRIEPESLTETEGVLTLTAAFYAGDEPDPAARFTVELVPNTRAGNSLFTYAIRSLELTE